MLTEPAIQSDDGLSYRQLLEKRVKTLELWRESADGVLATHRAKTTHLYDWRRDFEPGVYRAGWLVAGGLTLIGVMFAATVIAFVWEGRKTNRRLRALEARLAGKPEFSTL